MTGSGCKQTKLRSLPAAHLLLWARSQVSWKTEVGGVGRRWSSGGDRTLEGVCGRAPNRPGTRTGLRPRVGTAVLTDFQDMLKPRCTDRRHDTETHIWKPSVCIYMFLHAYKLRRMNHKPLYLQEKEGFRMESKIHI